MNKQKKKKKKQPHTPGRQAVSLTTSVPTSLGRRKKKGRWNEGQGRIEIPQQQKKNTP